MGSLGTSTVYIYSLPLLSSGKRSLVELCALEMPSVG